MNFKHTLQLSIVEGKDLAARDINGFSDPYCRVIVNESLEAKTKVIKKTLNPAWNETFTFSEISNKTGKFRIDLEVYDWDMLGKDEFIGNATIKFDTVIHDMDKEYSDEVQLRDVQYKSHERTGKLVVRYKVTNLLEEKKEKEQGWYYFGHVGNCFVPYIPEYLSFPEIQVSGGESQASTQCEKYSLHVCYGDLDAIGGKFYRTYSQRVLPSFMDVSIKSVYEQKNITDECPEKYAELFESYYTTCLYKGDTPNYTHHICVCGIAKCNGVVGVHLSTTDIGDEAIAEKREIVMKIIKNSRVSINKWPRDKDSY